MLKTRKGSSHASPAPPADYYHMWSVPPEENDDHAFSLWPDFTHDTSPDQGLRVKDRVIAFFKQYLHD